MQPQTQQVIMFIIGTIVVLLGAYYVTYFIGMKATGQTRAGLKNRNIRIIDRYSIARDKQFCIIEIAGKVYVVGATNHGMTLLDTFDAEAFVELTESNSESVPWNMTPVGSYGNRLTRKVVEYVAVKTGKKQQYDATHGVKDVDGVDKASFASSFENAQREGAEDEELWRESVHYTDREKRLKVTAEVEDALNIIESLSMKSDNDSSNRSW
ncbi:MAG: flagellar biosynthetic protein FliO [Oscillospiraceae bacterium]|nr:flagellar biosynthetic protein FliO [Oscillospiraceae bacterium]